MLRLEPGNTIQTWPFAYSVDAVLRDLLALRTVEGRRDRVARKVVRQKPFNTASAMILPTSTASFVKLITSFGTVIVSSSGSLPMVCPVMSF